MCIIQPCFTTWPVLVLVFAHCVILSTGTLVLLSLAYLTSLFYYIPKAALAAVIICAVAPMFDAKIIRTLWQVKSMVMNVLCLPKLKWWGCFNASLECITQFRILL